MEPTAAQKSILLQHVYLKKKTQSPAQKSQNRIKFRLEAPKIIYGISRNL